MLAKISSSIVNNSLFIFISSSLIFVNIVDGDFDKLFLLFESISSKFRAKKFCFIFKSVLIFELFKLSSLLFEDNISLGIYFVGLYFINFVAFSIISFTYGLYEL